MNAVRAVAKLVIKEIFRKKDFYVALILMAVILFFASNLRFYNVQNVARYLLEIGLSLVFLFSVILTVSLAARQVPHEREQRTLAALLAKPVTRFQFLLGKLLGSFLGGAGAFSIFYAVFLSAAAMKGGELPLRMALETYAAFLLCQLVLSAMAVGLSVYLTTAANVSITLILYLLVNTYGAGLKFAAAKMALPAKAASVACYYLLPHFEFFDLRQRFVHGWGPVGPKLMAFLAAYAAVYALFFLALGWIKFKDERI